MKRWKRPRRTGKITWRDDDHLQVGNAHFLLTLDPSIWEASDSNSDQFMLLKNRVIVENLKRFGPEHAENIVDLGIYKGGSVALLHELFSPRRIVGVDWLHDRADVLDRFVAQHSLGDAVRLYYDTSQADQERLSWILRENFRDEPLDLVVDDCSHLYELTKVSLNVFLPHVRPGGLYVIEDWGWAHWADDYWQGSTHQMVNEETPLSKLIIELLMVVASRPGLINEMTVKPGVVYLKRGHESISDPVFDISDNYLTAGRQILCEHPTAESTETA